MGSECVYSFWDLYKAANKQQATKEVKENFFNLSQEQRNEQVKKWAEKAGWGTEDRIGSDGQVYTAFSPLWGKSGARKLQP